MNTEQEIVEEKTIPNGEYMDRDLENSAYGPNQSSATSKKVAMKHESKDRVKGQYVGYRRRIRKKLKKKDQEIRKKNQEIKIYEGIIDTSPTLNQRKIDDLKRRIEKSEKDIAKLENDKDIIILDGERYYQGKFYRFAVTPIKLVGKFLSNIASKIRDYFNVIDIDMDFDQQSAQSMLNVGFNNPNTAVQQQVQTAQTQQVTPATNELTNPSTEQEESNNGFGTLFDYDHSPESIVSPITLTADEAMQDDSMLPLPETKGYSVYDNGGDELATLEDINRLNQQKQDFLSKLNFKPSMVENSNHGESPAPVEDDSDIDQLLTQIAQVYKDEMEKQQKLQEEVDERRKQEVEAKKQAEEAAEKERLAKEEEAETQKAIKDAEEKEKQAKEKLRLKLDAITRQVAQIKSQNEQLETTIEEASANISSYENRRKSAEDNANKILSSVQENYTTIEEKKRVADQTSTKIAELDQMLGVSPENLQPKTPVTQQSKTPVTQQSKTPVTQQSKSSNPYGANELETMLSEFNRQTGNIPNLNLDTILSGVKSKQGANSSVPGKGPRK